MASNEEYNNLVDGYNLLGQMFEAQQKMYKLVTKDGITEDVRNELWRLQGEIDAYQKQFEAKNS